MENPLPLTDDDGEVRDLTREDFARMKPSHDVLPVILGTDVAAALLARRGHPPGSGGKVSTTVRFDAEVISAFRATGRGWQTRMNDALKDWLKTHPPA
ncbi:MAG: BrnA antitoxin family protein [Magnetococcales bacterium]|nr:BrnA antitoxin family protein [Magnetococcales bacterium]